MRCWSATSLRSLRISASSSVVGPVSKPASRRVCLTQLRTVSGDPTPRSRATSTTVRSRSVTSASLDDAAPTSTSMDVP